MRHLTPERAIAISVAALTLAIAGCGGSSSSSTSSSTTTTAPTTATPTRKSGIESPAGAALANQGGLAKLAPVHKGMSPRIKGLDNVPITQAIPAVSGDLNAFWSQEFSNSHLTWPMVKDVLVQSAPASTPCPTATINPTDPWYTCVTSAGQALMFWPVPWMQQNVDTDPGGVNLTLGMAQMYSSLAVYAIGYRSASESGQTSDAQWALMTLCLTGTYANSVNKRSLFEPADQPTFTAWFNSLSPGSTAGLTTAQEQQAFVTGFNGGNPAACVQQAPTPTPTTTTTTNPTPTTGTATLTLTSTTP